MAQGDVHITDDGKIALDGDGNVLLHDANDECPECCGGGCPPDTIVVTFENVVDCVCVDLSDDPR
ncbi:MAG: hypothetical protein GVY12_00615, partial [Bacteroidetes bacterium]|nr:hypothetical protein [Bacteroidota bacterium]